MYKAKVRENSRDSYYKRKQDYLQNVQKMVSIPSGKMMRVGEKVSGRDGAG